MLTGIIFGLGLSELALIIVAVMLFMGPKRLQTIKPFLKVLYKNYLAYMKEVNAMQGEMDEMKKTIMEPLEEVEKEAEAELRGVERDVTKDLEGADEIKQGLRAIIDARKKEMEQLKKEAEIEENSKAGQKVNAAAVSRGANVGFLGKQVPGAQISQSAGAQTSPSSASQMQHGQQMAQFMQGQQPGQSINAMRRQLPGAQMRASGAQVGGAPDLMAARSQPASFQMPKGVSGFQLGQNAAVTKIAPKAANASGRPRVEIAQISVPQKAEVPEAGARIETKPESAAPLETKSEKENPEVEASSETSSPLKAEGAVIIARKSRSAVVPEQSHMKESVAKAETRKEDTNAKSSVQAKKPKAKKSRKRR